MPPCQASGWSLWILTLCLLLCLYNDGAVERGEANLKCHLPPVPCHWTCPVIHELNSKTPHWSRGSIFPEWTLLRMSEQPWAGVSPCTLPPSTDQNQWVKHHFKHLWHNAYFGQHLILSFPWESWYYNPDLSIPQKTIGMENYHLPTLFSFWPPKIFHSKHFLTRLTISSDPLVPMSPPYKICSMVK